MEFQHKLQLFRQEFGSKVFISPQNGDKYLQNCDSSMHDGFSVLQMPQVKGHNSFDGEPKISVSQPALPKITPMNKSQNSGEASSHVFSHLKPENPFSHSQTKLELELEHFPLLHGFDKHGSFIIISQFIPEYPIGHWHV